MKKRVSKFTLIEFINENKSLNRSINRSIGRSVGRSVGGGGRILAHACSVGTVGTVVHFRAVQAVEAASVLLCTFELSRL